MSNKNAMYYTQEGYDTLVNELNYLKNTRRAEIAHGQVEQVLPVPGAQRNVRFRAGDAGNRSASGAGLDRLEDVALLAGGVVLFTLPAVPLALLGGAVLLATSLWGQFRKGVTDQPVVEPLSAPPHPSFGLTLLEVLGNWMLFLAAAALSAWFLLRP